MDKENHTDLPQGTLQATEQVPRIESYLSLWSMRLLLQVCHKSRRYRDKAEGEAS